VSKPAADLAFARRSDRAAAERLIGVSRETWLRFDRHVEALDKWQRTTNLVAPDTLPHVWTRHVADSAQLVALAPEKPMRWVDFGSGAGFPGLVAAAMIGDGAVTLVESNLKKAAFLREAARAMGVAVSVIPDRAENVLAGPAGADIVSARAVAPLPDLLRLAAPLLTKGAIGLFPKGREASRELTEAAECWRFEATLHPSLTDPDATILRIHSFAGPR
jgi:16S rRNA (guanine527-N7)-methyltransferase